MKKHTTFSYIYYLNRAFFTGYGFSLILNLANKDAWISMLVGFIISIFIIKLVEKIKNKTDINHIENNKILKLLYLILGLFISIEILFIFQTFASNFFLIKSPTWFITLPACLLVLRITKNNWQTINRVGNILMYISLLMIIVLLPILFFYIDIEHYFPIFTIMPTSIFKTTCFYIAYSTTPVLFTLLIPDLDNNITKPFIYSNITILLMGIIIIGILGPNLLEIYRYPEYMVLKDIKILNFIEKIENIFTLSTLIDLFMVLTISMNSVKNFLTDKYKKITFPALLFTVYFTTLILGKYYKIALQLYYYLPVILLIFLITIILLTYNLKNKDLN